MSTATINIQEYCTHLAAGARAASRRLLGISGAARDRALRRSAQLLREEMDEILAANQQDLAQAASYGLSKSQVERLTLSEKRIEEMATAVEEIAAFPDPLGQILQSSIRPNGLEVQKVRVPLGVVLFIYESRPNVTSDAAALCLKSGNAVILRGGKEARYSNQAVARVMRQALADEGIPLEAFSLVEVTDRAAVGELLRLPQYIDVAIPRGGEELIRRVASEATMPVIKHYKGVCHIYVDESADMEMAVAITENSKCQRPGVCNAAETLLIHRKAAERILPAIAQRLGARNTEIRGCPETCRIVKAARQATAEDFGAEFLDLILASTMAVSSGSEQRSASARTSSMPAAPAARSN
jgi:glutamate-5-semialdehyde dehydrogenase